MSTRPATSRASPFPSGPGGSTTSNLESTITRLLVATKQLLAGLVKWSRGEVDEEEISQIYVKLGNDFNVACAAFARENITMNELMSVPAELRVCLESCLSHPPSQATLERHLPDVRQIIIGLLHGLRDKQRQYREQVAARRARDGGSSGKGKGTALPPPPPSSAGTAVNISGLPLTPASAGRSREDLRRFVSQAQAASASSVPEDSTSAARRYSSRSTGSDLGSASGSGAQQDPRRSATLSSHGSAGGIGPSRSGSVRESLRSARSAFDHQDAFATVPPHLPRNNSTASIESTRTVAGSSATAAAPPRGPTHERPLRRASPPPPVSRTRDGTASAVPHTPTTDPFGSVLNSAPSPVPILRPPSVASNASSVVDDPHHYQQAQAASLEALKASDHLSRRASKRYSAYAIQKMTSPTPGSASPSPGGSVSGGPPSNDRAHHHRATRSAGDLVRAGSGSSAGRELAGAAEVRRTGHGRTSSRGHGGLLAAGEPAPPLPPLPRSYSSQQTDLRNGNGPGGQASPIVGEDEQGSPAPSSSRSPPPAFPPPPVPGVVGDGDSSRGGPSSPVALRSRPDEGTPSRTTSPAYPPLKNATSTSHIATDDAAPALPPSPTAPHSEPEYPFSVFLQIGRDVKKARLTGPPDVQSMRQLFVERFGFNPGLAGWPDVYLRDTDAGVHYELEDMSEVKPGSVLSLNVDTVEAVKQHIDQGMSTLAQDIKELRATVTAMRRLSVSAAASGGPFALPLHSPSSLHAASHYEGAGGAATSPTLRGLAPAPSDQQYEQAAHKVLAMRKLHSTPNLAGGAQNGGEGDESTTVPTPSDAVSPAPTSLVVPEDAAGRPAPAAEPEATSGLAAEGSPATAAAAVIAEPFSPTMAVAPIVETLKSQHAEVQNLRHEIGVLRQVYSDFTSSTKEMFASVRVQTSHVQHLAQSKLSTDRAFVEAGTAKLEAESTDLVLQVDTLQDTIDTIRTDTLRGVKPRTPQLSEVAAALRKATDARAHLATWLGEVKPTWAQMWSVELSKILAEQKAVEEQATLLTELDDDLTEVAGVLANIQAVARQQLKGPGIAPPPPRRDLAALGGGPENTKEGLSTVLLEVKALQPDPSRRLEAIARAEKQRELELANRRTDEFADELGDFVGQGKLKKSGGIEETERMRQARSEATLRQMFQS